MIAIRARVAIRIPAACCLPAECNLCGLSAVDIDSRLEASMKNLHQFGFAAAVAAVLTFPISGATSAEESATVPTDPAFKADTGQINPGVQKPLPSQSSEVTNIPTPEEARRALLTPISKQPSVGDTPSPPRPEAQTVGGPSTKRESQNAIGGAPGTTTAGSAPGSDASKTSEQTHSAATGGGA